MTTTKHSKFFISTPLKYIGYYLIALYTAFALIAEHTIMPSTQYFDFSIKPMSILFAVSFMFFGLYVLLDKNLPFFFDKLPNLSSTKRTDDVQYFWIIFAFCTIVSLIFLKIGYPGIYTPDSMVTLYQAQTGEYQDWHPIFYSFWFTIAYKIHTIIKIGGTYEIVVIFQTLFASFILAIIFQQLYKNGFNKYVLFILCVILMLIPTTGWLMISLWKDIPYSFTIMLVGFLIYISFLDKLFFEQNIHVLIMSIFTSFVILFRYNGLIPFLLTIIYLLLIVYFRKSKKTLITAILSIIIFLVVQNGLTLALNVKSTKAGHAAFLYSAPVYAAMKYGKEEILLPKTKEYLAEHRHKFEDPSILIYRASFVTSIPAEISRDEFFNILKKEPLLLIRLNLDRAISMWHVIPYMGEAYPNGAYVTSVAHILENANRLWRILFKETGIWIILCFFLSWFLLTRNIVAPTLSLMPAIGNGVSLLIIMQAQDYRYIWCIFLSAFLFFILVYKSYKNNYPSNRNSLLEKQ